MNRRINVLHVIFDDLRPELFGAYGQRGGGAPLTPNFDRLASEGVSFSHAYADFAVCGPSRNSFLSGRRPDKNGALTFLSSFRDDPAHRWWRPIPGAATAPGLRGGREKHGWRAQTFGLPRKHFSVHLGSLLPVGMFALRLWCRTRGAEFPPANGHTHPPTPPPRVLVLTLTRES